MELALLSKTLLSKLAFSAILILGDSHLVGPFGKKLDQLFRTGTPNEVYTYGVCGAVAQWFRTGQGSSCGYYFNEPFESRTSTPIAMERLTTLRPALTIVALGTNYALFANDASIKNDMSELAQNIRAQGSNCVWITLPDTRRFRATQQHIVDLTVAAVSDQCLVINSLKMTAYPSGCFDGIHYNCTDGSTIAENWARQVYDEVLAAGLGI